MHHFWVWHTAPTHNKISKIIFNYLIASFLWWVSRMSIRAQSCVCVNKDLNQWFLPRMSSANWITFQSRNFLKWINHHFILLKKSLVTQSNQIELTLREVNHKCKKLNNKKAYEFFMKFFAKVRMENGINKVEIISCWNKISLFRSLDN